MQVLVGFLSQELPAFGYTPIAVPQEQSLTPQEGSIVHPAQVQLSCWQLLARGAPQRLVFSAQASWDDPATGHAQQTPVVVKLGHMEQIRQEVGGSV